ASGLAAIVRFFFSSRRRHTRFSRDWSSDVCSSDLVGIKVLGETLTLVVQVAFDLELGFQAKLEGLVPQFTAKLLTHGQVGEVGKIGRASCRERGEMWVGARSWKSQGEGE